MQTFRASRVPAASVSPLDRLLPGRGIAIGWITLQFVIAGATAEAQGRPNAAGQPSSLPSPTAAGKRKKTSKIDLTPFAQRKRVKLPPAVPANGPLEANPFLKPVAKRAAPAPLGSPIPKGQRITRQAKVSSAPVLGIKKLPAQSFELRRTASGGHELFFQSGPLFRWDSSKPFVIQLLSSWGFQAKPGLITESSAAPTLKASPYSQPVQITFAGKDAKTGTLTVSASYTVCGPQKLDPKGAAKPGTESCRSVVSKRVFTPEELGLKGSQSGARGGA
jgi:hypothetical protein